MTLSLANGEDSFYRRAEPKEEGNKDVELLHESLPAEYQHGTVVS